MLNKRLLTQECRRKLAGAMALLRRRWEDGADVISSKKMFMATFHGTSWTLVQTTFFFCTLQQAKKGKQLNLRLVPWNPEDDYFSTPRLKCTQFLVWVCFAITCNKAYGQSVWRIGAQLTLLLQKKTNQFVDKFVILPGNISSHVVDPVASVASRTGLGPFHQTHAHMSTTTVCSFISVLNTFLSSLPPTFIPFLSASTTINHVETNRNIHSHGIT